MNTFNQPQSSSLSSSNNDNRVSHVLFTEDFIVATAKVFKLNTDHLRDTLAEAADCYRIDSAYFRRLDQWLEAKYILRDSSACGACSQNLAPRIVAQPEHLY